MKQLKKYISVILCVMLLAGCQNSTTTSSSTTSTSSNTIQFSNSTKVTGNGVSVNDDTVTISEGGTYELSGTSENGQVIVDAKDQEVTLVLNNLTLTNTSSSPIYIKKAKQVTITLKEGTTSTLKDSSSYQNSDDETLTATIYSKADLIFNGTGTLNIEANYNNAIQSKDNLTFEEGTYSITSVDDGIVGKDSLTFVNGTYTLKTTGDSIKTTNDSDSTLGNLVIQNGTFIIESEADGISSKNILTIQNGNFNIKTTSLSSDISTKGIKATSSIDIEEGTFVIDTVDDAIHSNGTITINQGTFTLSTQDDGIHADEQITINNGQILVKTSYEGIEANVIEINNGTIDVTSSDDGINVAGGNDQSDQNGPFGGDPFSSSGNSNLTINGGNVVVKASGDGLDANGSIYINGGTIYVNGPASDGDGALDYDNECIVTGGTLLAIGSTGMAQNVSDGSQTSFITTLSQKYSPGSVIKIVDESNQTILDYTALTTYQSLVLSSSLLEVGKTYTIYVDGNEDSTITLSDTVTGTSGMMGGPMGGQMGNPGQGIQGGPSARPE